MSQTPAPKQPFQKPWLNWTDQVAKLKGRGLVVSDEAAAEAFLSHINYYRFSGYCLAFEQARHQLVAGTSFEQIREAYDFDCKLRDLVAEALEYIEIDVRTTMAYRFAEAHGPMGHLDSARFHQPMSSGRRRPKKGAFDYARWLKDIRRECKRSREEFVKHIRSKYNHGDDLPIWVATEIMSFGCLSRMFQGMHKPQRRAVAVRYGLQPNDLESWLHHLVYIRNICAHHSRLWDRRWHIQPTRLHGNDWQATSVPTTDRLFVTLLILSQMKLRCEGIAPAQTEWRDRVIDLLRQPPSCPSPESRMGLPPGWDSHTLWS